MTTVARGFWTSAPVPVASAIGTKPSEATRAVMTTGRKRVSDQRANVTTAHLRGGHDTALSILAADLVCALGLLERRNRPQRNRSRRGVRVSVRKRHGKVFQRRNVVAQRIVEANYDRESP